MAGERKKASSAGRELGRLGAKKGGLARARALTPAERSEIARRAVRARWAKSGKVLAAPVGGAPTADGLPRSLFHGHLTMDGVGLEGHVLSDGRRVLEDEGVHEAFTGEEAPDTLDRILRKLPRGSGLAGFPSVVFRRPALPDPASGYEAATVAAMCELLLCARAAGPLKKQPARAAAVAETLLRSTATAGIVGLVDDATGYGALRARQSTQRTVEALIAEDIDRWAERFPKEFWREVARIEGAPSSKVQTIGWARYVVPFVADAVDPDVGRELRRTAHDPAFRPTIHQWLLEVGGARLDGAMASILAGMHECRDRAEFDARFAKVLDKAPSRSRLPEGIG